MTAYPALEHEYLHMLGWATGTRWLLAQGRVGEEAWDRAVAFLTAAKAGGGHCLVRSVMPRAEEALAACCSTMAPTALASPKFIANALELRSIGLMKVTRSLVGRDHSEGPSAGDCEAFDTNWAAGGHKFGESPILLTVSATHRYWTGIEPAEKLNLMGIVEQCLPQLRDGAPVAAFVDAERIDRALAAAAGAWPSLLQPTSTAKGIDYHVPGSGRKR